MPPELMAAQQQIKEIQESLPVLSNNERLLISAVWGVAGYLLGGKGQIGLALGVAGAAWYIHRLKQQEQAKLIQATQIVKPVPVVNPALQGYYWQ